MYLTLVTNDVPPLMRRVGSSTDLSSAGSGVMYSMNYDFSSTPLNTYHVVFQSLRTNIQYHKVFKDISEDEHLRQSTCEQIDLIRL